MVRSDSADEEQMIADEKYEQMEDEDFADAGGVWRTASQDAIDGQHSDNRMLSQPASLSPNGLIDPDRRLRRQIANCNERRRMQSINAGFQSLRALLPRKEGEKLSKAAILQQTADLIHQLKNGRSDSNPVGGKKPKLEVEAGSDAAEQRAIVSRLQAALERERTTRAHLEQQVAQLREQFQRQQTQLQSSTSASPLTSCTNSPAVFAASTSPVKSNVHSPAHENSEQILSMATTNFVLQTADHSPVLQQLPMTINYDLPQQQQQNHHEASVIRPTPLSMAPISVDVSSPTLSISSPLAMPVGLDQPLVCTTALQNPDHGFMFANHNNSSAPAQPQPPAFNLYSQSQPSAFSSTVSLNAHRSLQTILDAIRHLEGNCLMTASPPPTSQAPLVR